MRTTLATLATILAASAAPALAQSSDDPFQGPFVGVGIGGQSNEVDGGPILNDDSEDNFAFTGFAGYDHRLTEKVVIGAELGAVFSSDAEQDLQTAAGPLEFDPEYEINLSGRLGYLVRPDTLVYARAGYSTLQADLTGAGINRDEDFDGWLGGAGVEYAFRDKYSVRAEYRYQDLSENDIDVERNQAFVSVLYRF